MFSSEYSSLRRAWVSEPRLAALGTVVGIGAAGLLISPRLAPFLFVFFVAYWCWGGLGRREARAAIGESRALILFVGLFVLYGLMSSFWSVRPGDGVGKVLLLGIVILAAVATAHVVAKEPRANILHASEGLWLGFLFGLTYYFVEAATDQGIKIWLINTLGVPQELLRPSVAYYWKNGKLEWISVRDFTRGATPITLLVWPALMAARGAVVKPWGERIGALILGLAVASALLSPQESSKVAIVIGLIAFGLGWYCRTWAARLIGAAWVVACLAVVPAALLAHRLDLHNAPWLQSTAQHRIVIWNHTAERVLKAPVLGVGAYMIYLVGDDLAPGAEHDPNEPFEKTLSRHSHNVFLQTWLELGAVGALLLMAMGLQVIRRIGRLKPDIQPYALAMFSSAATLMAATYGMWQTWFMTLFGLATILFAVGARALQTAQRDAMAAQL